MDAFVMAIATLMQTTVRMIGDNNRLSYHSYGQSATDAHASHANHKTKTKTDGKSAIGFY